VDGSELARAFFTFAALVGAITDIGRRFATRFDKRTVNLVACIKRTSIRNWLRAYEATP
jgi:hypothetical protein